MILAISKTGEIIGAINLDQYQGAEYEFPYGWKELIDSGVSFDQVDFEPISTEQNDAILSFYQPMTKVRNVLYAYHGGGSDGCIWEWNYSYFDENGEFWNIYSSGSMGCFTEKAMIERIKEGRDIEEINLESELERNHFADNEAIKGVVRCAKFFAENNIDVKIRPKCNYCGERFAAIEANHLHAPHNVGGIESSSSQIICQNCWDTHSCDGCDEFFGKRIVLVRTENYQHACTCCAQKDAERETPA